MYEIELNNGVVIYGLTQYGYGFVEDGKYKIKGDLSNILDCIKNNTFEILSHDRLELDFAVNGNLTKQRITIPFDTIYQIRNEYEILYDIYDYRIY